MRAVLAQIEGHYAFVASHVGEPDRLVAVRHECPLVVGVGTDETFVASALPAFLGETREGFLEFLPFCLAVGMVLATGRSVRYPGEILADPTSTWLAVGAALVALYYVRSWLKLVLRRA